MGNKACVTLFITRIFHSSLVSLSGSTFFIYFSIYLLSFIFLVKNPGNPGNRTMDGYELVNILAYKIVGSPLNTDEQLHNHL